MDQTISSVECILAEAVEIASPAERQAFVDKACAGNADLRAQVEHLMANHFRAGSFLERPAAVLETAALPAPSEAPGTQIGPYKLLEQIGEGGMGLVYIAEQQKPVRRTVALKLIKPGMDSKQVIARFEAERQALALMDHPNIAKVLDAGTTAAGRPYFVMELVRGIPITEYCDQARLTIRQRLELFVQVCRAVQHAHTKGVIHRDLKPSNVLVTSHDGVPVPLVIDFGVAKALEQQLTARTLHTGFAQMIGTPLYMSPEQAEFNRLGVDTRSDIYSLGVVLYELLTGTTPFDQERLRTADHDEFRRILRAEEPPRPSARVSTLGAAFSTASDRRGVDARKLTQTLHGELDWIVLKSLEKDRTRRYETASAFASDVERYLKDEPVAACPPTVSYRLRKFAHRNKVVLITSGLIAATLLLSTAVSIWQAVEATAARERAETAYQNETRHRQRARNAVDTMYTDVAEKLLPTVPGMGGMRKEFLLKALAFYEEEAARESNDPEVRLGTAWANKRIGRIYWTINDNEKALEAYNRALALIEELLAEDGSAPERRSAQALFLFERSWVNYMLRRLPAAATDRSRSLELYRQLLSEYPDVSDYRHSVVHISTCLGFLAKDLKEAESLNRAGLALAEKTASEFPDDLEYRKQVGHACLNLGQVLRRRGRLDEAERVLKRALPIWKTYAEGPHFHPEGLYHVALCLIETGTVRGLRSEADATATESFREAAAILRRLAADFPGQTPTNGKGQLLSALIECRRFREAFEYSREVLESDKDNPYLLNMLAWYLATCPDPKLRDPKQAVDLAQKAVETRPHDPDYWNTLGIALYRANNCKGAVSSLLRSIELQSDGAAADYFFLAMAQYQLGDKAIARTWYDKALAWMDTYAPNDEELGRFRTEAEGECLGISAKDLKNPAK